jgi:short-subunit dehydrogenase
MEKIALITGASKGIGKEFAEVFAKNGYSLLLIARNISDLKLLQRDLKNKYQCTSKILSVDLAELDSIDLIMDTFKDEMTQVEVLVNNAGLGYANKFIDISYDETVTTMEVNIVALTKLTHRVLPFMLMRKSGKILNVASTAAYFPGPNMAVYYASKAYILSFSQALREEYQDEGIHVCVLCPGLTKSAFQKRAGLQHTFLVNSGLFPMMSAAKVAEIGYKGLQNNKRTIIPGFSNQLNVFLSWLFPSFITGKITGLIQKPPTKK